MLAGTELWERISFHGMVALLTLYMAECPLLAGQRPILRSGPVVPRNLKSKFSW